MRIPLRIKILASFALIVLLSIGTAVGAGNRLTRVRFDDYSYRRDVARASFLAIMLTDWLIGMRDGTKTRPPFPMEPPPSPENTSQMRGREASQFMDRMGGKHGGPGPMGFDRMVVTDVQGNVLLDTTGENRRTLSPNLYENAVIRDSSEVLGYLYVGRMIPDLTQNEDVPFFRAVGIATWEIAAAVFLMAMILGILLTRHIVSPIMKLNAAARSVGNGDLAVRVPSARRDELGELSREFNNMASSLESAEESRRRFIADSAHELRTPVSLIRARIEMMEEGIYPFDPENLAALSAETERLNSLVEQLRTLSDLEARESGGTSGSNNGVMENPVPVDLSELVREAVAASEPALLRRAIRTEIHTEGVSLSPRGDRDGLYRLVVNLLSNAIRHASSRVLIGIEEAPPARGEEKKRVRLVVEDDGPGIPEDRLNLIFERYYRLDASRSRDAGGSGLGLAICRGIVRNHGGGIRAGRSESLGGASFAVELPV